MPKNCKRAIPLPVVPPDGTPHDYRTGGVGFLEGEEDAACERCGNTHDLATIVVVSREDDPDVPSVSAAMALCSACLAEAYHVARGVRFDRSDQLSGMSAMDRARRGGEIYDAYLAACGPKQRTYEPFSH